MNDLTIDQPLGTEFFRFPNLASLTRDSYFQCIKEMKLLFESPAFQISTPGFYINYISNSEGGESVRLSYFTRNPEATSAAIDEFCANGSVKLFDSADSRRQSKSNLDLGNISAGYGGEELRFRKFLSTYTRIGMDLIDYNILYSRRLAAEYRINYSTRKIPSRPLFEPAFIRHSPFFNQLDVASREQLWKDLDYWHTIPGGENTGLIQDWAHFLVSMLLPGDWNNRYEVRLYFLTPRPCSPLTGDVRETMLSGMGLYLPVDWNPAEETVEIKIETKKGD